jgi:hypothetical protein
VNLHHIEKLKLGNRQITVHDVASNSGISVGSEVTQESMCPVGSKDVNV